MKLILRESETGNEKVANPEQANNSNQLKLLSMPSPTSTSTSMPMDLSESNLAIPTSSPASSLSESESRFCYLDRQFVLQSRIDSAFKQIKSFGEGGMYKSRRNQQCHPFHYCQRQYVFPDSR